MLNQFNKKESVAGSTSQDKQRDEAKAMLNKLGFNSDSINTIINCEAFAESYEVLKKNLQLIPELKEKFKDEQIAEVAKTSSKNLKALFKNYKKLFKFGFSDSQIAQILKGEYGAKNVKTITELYSNLTDKDTVNFNNEHILNIINSKRKGFKFLTAIALRHSILLKELGNNENIVKLVKNCKSQKDIFSITDDYEVLKKFTPDQILEIAKNIHIIKEDLQELIKIANEFELNNDQFVKAISSHPNGFSNLLKIAGDVPMPLNDENDYYEPMETSASIPNRSIDSMIETTIINDNSEVNPATEISNKDEFFQPESTAVADQTISLQLSDVEEENKILEVDKLSLEELLNVFKNLGFNESDAQIIIKDELCLYNYKEILQNNYYSLIKTFDKSELTTVATQRNNAKFSIAKNGIRKFMEFAQCHKPLERYNFNLKDIISMASERMNGDVLTYIVDNYEKITALNSKYPHSQISNAHIVKIASRRIGHKNLKAFLNHFENLIGKIDTKGNKLTVDDLVLFCACEGSTKHKQQLLENYGILIAHGYDHADIRALSNRKDGAANIAIALQITPIIDKKTVIRKFSDTTDKKLKELRDELLKEAEVKKQNDLSTNDPMAIDDRSVATKDKTAIINATQSIDANSQNITVTSTSSLSNQPINISFPEQFEQNDAFMPLNDEDDYYESMETSASITNRSPDSMISTAISKNNSEVNPATEVSNKDELFLVANQTTSFQLSDVEEENEILEVDKLSPEQLLNVFKNLGLSDAQKIVTDGLYKYYKNILEQNYYSLIKSFDKSELTTVATQRNNAKFNIASKNGIRKFMEFAQCHKPLKRYNFNSKEIINMASEAANGDVLTYIVENYEKIIALNSKYPLSQISNAHIVKIASRRIGHKNLKAFLNHFENLIGKIDTKGNKLTVDDLVQFCACEGSAKQKQELLRDYDILITHGYAHTDIRTLTDRKDGGANITMALKVTPIIDKKTVIEKFKKTADKKLKELRDELLKEVEIKKQNELSTNEVSTNAIQSSAPATISLATHQKDKRKRSYPTNETSFATKNTEASKIAENDTEVSLQIKKRKLTSTEFLSTSQKSNSTSETTITSTSTINTLNAPVAPTTEGNLDPVLDFFPQTMPEFVFDKNGQLIPKPIASESINADSHNITTTNISPLPNQPINASLPQQSVNTSPGSNINTASKVTSIINKNKFKEIIGKCQQATPPITNTRIVELLEEYNKLKANIESQAAESNTILQNTSPLNPEYLMDTNLTTTSPLETQKPLNELLQSIGDSNSEVYTTPNSSLLFSPKNHSNDQQIDIGKEEKEENNQKKQEK